MKDHGSLILSLLAGLSLLTIGIIFYAGYLKNKSQTTGQMVDFSKVLGESTRSQPVNSLPSTVNGYIKNTIEGAQNTLTEKTKEVETQVLTEVQKQLAEMTASQVLTLKTQICRDWGVISPQPTAAPASN